MRLAWTPSAASPAVNDSPVALLAACFAAAGAVRSAPRVEVGFPATVVLVGGGGTETGLAGAVVDVEILGTSPVGRLSDDLHPTSTSAASAAAASAVAGRPRGIGRVTMVISSSGMP